MKKFISLITVVVVMLISVNIAFSQCEPYIRIDGDRISANENAPNAIKLPVWLNSSNTIAVDSMVSSISVIEFTENSGTLEYSAVISITSTTPQSPPAGKIWKVESIIKPASITVSDGAVYSGAGTYTLNVPSCATYVCIEAWGAGGGGGGANTGSSSYIGGGGGGGGYGKGCFTLSSQTLTITVGNAGSHGTGLTTDGAQGGATTITGGGVNMSVEGGYGGQGFSNGAAGGAGGSAITGCTTTITGGNGNNGGTAAGQGGAAGGSPDNPGGFGGFTGPTYHDPAESPGGGGGGTCYSGSYYYGGKSANGKVIVTW